MPNSLIAAAIHELAAHLQSQCPFITALYPFAQQNTNRIFVTEPNNQWTELTLDDSRNAYGYLRFTEPVVYHTEVARHSSCMMTLQLSLPLKLVVWVRGGEPFGIESAVRNACMRAKLTSIVEYPTTGTQKQIPIELKLMHAELDTCRVYRTERALKATEPLPAALAQYAGVSIDCRLEAVVDVDICAEPDVCVGC